MVGDNGSSSSRMALRNAAAGQIVEVQGGHIMRATGRKDRHSKVCTAKGPRERRVRLSAHTAIQFYDVQDRLGYDRPSKAVDWLIKKAKAAIDELDELPAWKPVPTNNSNSNYKSPGGEEDETLVPGEGAGGGFFIGNNVDSNNLLPPSMDSDSIADTIKSFFPVGGESSSAHGVTASSSGSVSLQPEQFQSYPVPSSDSLSRRDCSQSQDLKLSLQSFQDPMVIQSHHRHPHHPHQNQEVEQQSSFPGAAQTGFDNPSACWDETQQADMGRFQRLIGWNLASGSCGGGGGGTRGGFMFIPPQPLQQQQLLFGHGVGNHGFGHNATHFFSQGGPLQSNSTPLVRACLVDNSVSTTTSNQDHHDHRQTVPLHPASLSGIGFSSLRGFSNFQIPARIQGDEEEQDGNPNKPSSVASGSGH